jgi:hypothetical protein
VRRAISHSSASFAAVATLVKVRTLLYDSAPASNAPSIFGNLVSTRPIRNHSRAVHTSTSSAAATQCAHVGAPSTAHSPDSSSTTTSRTNRRCAVNQCAPTATMSARTDPRSRSTHIRHLRTRHVLFGLTALAAG